MPSSPPCHGGAKSAMSRASSGEVVDALVAALSLAAGMSACKDSAASSGQTAATAMQATAARGRPGVWARGVDPALDVVGGKAARQREPIQNSSSEIRQKNTQP